MNSITLNPVLVYDKKGTQVGQYSFYEWVKTHPEYGHFLGVNSSQTKSEHQRKGKEVLQEYFKDDVDELYNTIESGFNYKLIKVHHNRNGTNWVICLDYNGQGLEIVGEEVVS